MVAILFVDDEPHILDGLRRMLRQWRHQWEMTFVADGAAALAKLETQSFDAIVSDMRMPGMDGAQLLTEVAARSPATIRLVLSGQHDREALFRVIRVAHGILAKPCEPDLLVRTIGRALALRSRLGADGIRATVNGLVCLPTLPQIYHDLYAELSADEPSLEQIAAVVEADPPLTAKLLQIVNFTPFAARTQLTSVVQAVRHLGIDLLKAILLKHGIIAQLPPEALRGLPLASLWNRSARTAALAQQIGAAAGLAQYELTATVTAAMLHEIGALLLAVDNPAGYRTIIESTRAGARRLQEERRIFGVESTTVGAYLLDLWGLPPLVVEAIALCGDCEDRSGLSLPTRILAVAASLAGTADDGWPAVVVPQDLTASATPEIVQEVRAWTKLTEAAAPTRI